jgi:hypothetical protein
MSSQKSHLTFPINKESLEGSPTRSMFDLRAGWKNQFAARRTARKCVSTKALTDTWISIWHSDRQCWNPSIFLRCESVANVISLRDVHSENEYSPMTSTDDGNATRHSDLQLSNPWISLRCESAANVISLRDEQSENEPPRSPQPMQEMRSGTVKYIC